MPRSISRGWTRRCSSLFAGAAVTLAAIGLYSLFMLMVSERAREMAVRLAIGAEPRQLVQLVMAGAGRLLAGGIVLGIAADGRRRSPAARRALRRQPARRRRARRRSAHAGDRLGPRRRGPRHQGSADRANRRAQG